MCSQQYVFFFNFFLAFISFIYLFFFTLLLKLAHSKEKVRLQFMGSLNPGIHLTKRGNALS